ncbi:hypothetical protein [uncultured Stenotrophomonas sp.]|uniref:hypothetical protein n=1 Tax=uncultured Stenotrophomonas sp. TaxID=165438 RepID=UPI0025F36B83|nr:hypothetical protein [uncultured Stenotrophomonas sp.]
MADFSWLNEIPDAGFPSHGDGFLKAFPLIWFLERSGLRAGDDWRNEFDAWGSEQPREYQQFLGPTDHSGDSLAWIAGGSWAAGHNDA